MIRVLCLAFFLAIYFCSFVQAGSAESYTFHVYMLSDEGCTGNEMSASDATGWLVVGMSHEEALRRKIQPENYKGIVEVILESSRNVVRTQATRLNKKPPLSRGASSSNNQASMLRAGGAIRAFSRFITLNLGACGVSSTVEEAQPISLITFFTAVSPSSRLIAEESYDADGKIQSREVSWWEHRAEVSHWEYPQTVNGNGTENLFSLLFDFQPFQRPVSGHDVSSVENLIEVATDLQADDGNTSIIYGPYGLFKILSAEQDRVTATDHSQKSPSNSYYLIDEWLPSHDQLSNKIGYNSNCVELAGGQRITTIKAGDDSSTACMLVLWSSAAPRVAERLLLHNGESSLVLVKERNDADLLATEKE